MRKVTKRNLSPEISLISAIIVHASIEIPFFIFPVIVLSVGEDLFQNMEGFRWVGLGAIGTVGTLAAGLPSPIFGSLADRYRRGSMMFFSLILSSFGALVVGLFSGSFFAMLIGILLMGLGVSLYHPPGLSWVSTAFEDPKTRVYSSKYNRILALHGIGGTIGASLGPISVYFLIDSIDWHQIYLLWFLPIFLIALAFWVLIGRHEPAVEILIPPSRTYGIDSANKLVTNQKQNNYSIMWIIFAFFIVMSLTRGMISFILSPFLIEEKKFETAEAAFFVGFSTLLGVVGQLSGGYFADKYSEKFVLSFCAACEAVILAGIYIVDVYLVLLFLYILLGVISALFWPSSNSLIAKNATRRGSAFGWFMLVGSVIGAFGPGIDGVLISLDPNHYFFIFCFACLFSMIAFISLSFLKNQNNSSEYGVSE